MAHRSRTPPKNAADQSMFRRPDEVAYRAVGSGEPAVTRCTHAGKVKGKKISYIGPTVFWLTHAALANIVARYERFGGVKAVEAMLKEDKAFGELYLASHDAYVAAVLPRLPDEQREFFVEHYSGPNAKGRKYGNAAVGEPLSVKCLHAHVGAALAGVPNPIGAAVCRYTVAMAAALKAREAARRTSSSADADKADDGADATAASSSEPAVPAGDAATMDVTDDFPRNFAAFVARNKKDAFTLEGVDINSADFDVCGAALALVVHFDGHAPSFKKKHRIN
uniref:DUF501 domain-containing protein n=1 Tax=Neobodo designis TaxID=312471 RepID=A0A7S1Q820_NEODS